MLIPHETKQIETGRVRRCCLLTREVYEKKQLRPDFRKTMLFSEKVMLLKQNRLFAGPGGKEGQKKGAPK